MEQMHEGTAAISVIGTMKGAMPPEHESTVGQDVCFGGRGMVTGMSPGPAGRS